MSLADAAWLWIPITLSAAFAQTLRNAAQRHLTAELGTLGATLVRFLYGLPFAIAWLVVVLAVQRASIPPINARFLIWTVIGAAGQLVATALLLRVMAERNFALGVAYSKTELVQVAIFGALFLGDPLTATTALAVAFATGGVLLLTPVTASGKPLHDFLAGWLSRPALLGIACGATFAVSAVGYRGATLALAPANAALAAAFTLVWSQGMQSVMLGGWLQLRAPETVRRVLRAWRISLFAGFMGALASGCWFTAMALAPVAYVRTLGVTELLFSLVVSRRVFRETLDWRTWAGIALIALGIVGVALSR